MVGGDVSYALSGKTGVTAFNVAASYTKGPLVAAVTSANKVSSFSLGLMYDVNSTLTVASTSTHSADKPIDGVTVGGLYKANIGDIKAKYSGSGVVSAALVKTVAPKVTLSRTCNSTLQTIFFLDMVSAKNLVEVRNSL